LNTQLSFFDDLIDKEPFTVLDLLKQHFDLTHIIPYEFIYKFYKNFGRKREYSLLSFLSALMIQKLFSIPTDTLLLTFLNISKELRDFCGLSNKVFDKTQLSRFKSTFADELENLFHVLVDITEPMCQALDKQNAKILSIDTTGIEPYVAENNDKVFNSLFKQWERFISNNTNESNKTDAFLAAWANMPKTSVSNNDAKLQYINAHYAYALKTAVVCNSMGIIRHLEFCGSSTQDNALLPEENKSISDSKIFKTTLNNFVSLHPQILHNSKYILGDSGFDSTENFNYAFNTLKLIPIIAENPRGGKSELLAELKNPQLACPKDPTLPLSFDGVIKGKNRNTRFKFLCPKTKRTKDGYVCTCEEPCTNSKCGYIQYDFPKDDIRANAPVKWDTPQWTNLYKKRVAVERDISILKLPLVLGGSYLRKTITSKADFFMAGIAHLAIVCVAFRSKLYHKVRCVKSIA
jgi:hypothetical protein